MASRPDVPALLGAVSQFLLAEVQPALAADKALQFRVLVAAWLLSVVDGELRDPAQRELRELESLRALLTPEQHSEPEHDPEARARALRQLNLRLCAHLRAAPPEQWGPLREHLQRTLADTLAYSNPRFDLDRDLP